MSYSLRAAIQLVSVDLAVGSSSAIDESWQDASPTTHDYVDPTPLNVATPGAPGSSFVTVPTSASEIERVVAFLPPGCDLVLRFGGAPASVLGSVTSPSLAGSDDLVFALDNGVVVTAVFAGTENTIAKVAAVIDAALVAAGLTGASATVDTATGGLRITGAKTGGQSANASNWQSGAVDIQSGAAVTKLGLTVAKTWATGRDIEVSGGLFAVSFPSNALPARFEVSGTATSAKFRVAGRAS